MDAENPGADTRGRAEPVRAGTGLRPKLDPASRARIGRELRSLYADLLDEPLSPQLSHLIAELAAAEPEEVAR